MDSGHIDIINSLSMGIFVNFVPDFVACEVCKLYYFNAH